MATTIENAINKARKSGIIDLRSREAIDWYRTNLRKTAVSPNRLMKEERANLVNSWSSLAAGQLYMAFYDPKHKDKLPFYDTFPLIIPMERYKDGILGMNIHYLPPMLRAKLFDSIIEREMDEAYNILGAAGKLNYIKPCMKRYLGNHFRSRFLRVPAEQWPLAAMLPSERFVKASKSQVWANTRRKI